MKLTYMRSTINFDKNSVLDDKKVNFLFYSRIYATGQSSFVDWMKSKEFFLFELKILEIM